MRRVGLVLVVLVLVVVLKFKNKNNDSADVLNDMKAAISRLDVYAANAEYLDRLIEREHERAFEAAYNVGGRRRGASFDEDKYLAKVLDAMVRDAYREKKDDVAKGLELLKAELEGAPAPS